jgi:hypothetical protein
MDKKYLPQSRMIFSCASFAVKLLAYFEISWHPKLVNIVALPSKHTRRKQCDGMPESRIEESFPRQQTQAFPL